MSKNHWFRVKNNLVHDPKVQRLPPKLFKALINLWCLASQNDGVLPSNSDVAHHLHLTDKKASELILALFSLGFFDRNDDGMAPHNWSEHQRPSDNSTTRTKAYRERERSQERKCDGLEKRREELDKRREEPPISPKGDLRFEQFWNVYPHKVGKAAALKSFQRAFREKGTSLNAILSGVKDYIASKPPDRPWCNPATWLNQHRWLDVPGPEPHKPSVFMDVTERLIQEAREQDEQSASAIEDFRAYKGNRGNSECTEGEFGDCGEDSFDSASQFRRLAAPK